MSRAGQIVQGLSAPRAVRVVQALAAYERLRLWRVVAPERLNHVLRDDSAWLHFRELRDRILAEQLAAVLLGSPDSGEFLRALRPDGIDLRPMEGLSDAPLGEGPTTVEDLLAGFRDHLEDVLLNLAGSEPPWVRQGIERARRKITQARGIDAPSTMLASIPFQASWSAAALAFGARLDPHRRTPTPGVQLVGQGELAPDHPWYLAAAEAFAWLSRTSQPLPPATHIPVTFMVPGYLSLSGESLSLPLFAALAIAVRHGRPLPPGVALTGRLSEGEVHGVDGAKNKARAAYSAGVRVLILPEDDVSALRGWPDRPPGLQFEGVPTGHLEAEELALWLEERIAHYFPHALQPRASILRAKYAALEEQVWTHRPGHVPQRLARLRRLVSSAERHSTSSDDLLATLVPCCDWLEGYCAHQQGQIEAAVALLEQSRAQFEQLYAARRLDAIAYFPWLEVQNLLGIRFKFLFQHEKARELLTSNLGEKRSNTRPFVRAAMIGATLGSLGQLEAAVGNFERAVSLQREAQHLVPVSERNRQVSYEGYHLSAWAAAGGDSHWEAGRACLERVWSEDKGAPHEASQRRSNADFALLYLLIHSAWHGDVLRWDGKLDEARAEYQNAGQSARQLRIRRPGLLPQIGADLWEGAAHRGLTQLGEHSAERASHLLETACNRLRAGPLPPGSSKPHGLRGQLLAILIEQLRLALVRTQPVEELLEEIREELNHLGDEAASFRFTAVRLAQQGDDRSLAELVQRLVR